MRIVLFMLIVFLIVGTACSESEIEDTSNTSKTSNSSSEEEAAENEVGSADFQINHEIEFKGFIGGSAITGKLAFGEVLGQPGEVVRGSYYYDKFKKNISLTGRQVDWYGGPIYEITEYTSDGDTTGIWRHIWQQHDLSYTGDFYPDRESVSGSTPIAFLPSVAEGVLHGGSHMSFSSDAEAKKFFEIHKFLNDDPRRRGGVIMKDVQEDFMEDHTLPSGLVFYEQDGGDGFAVEEAGYIDEEGTFIYNDGQRSLTDEEYNVQYQAVGYEVLMARFHSVPSKEYVELKGLAYNSVFIKIKDLEKQGYHLEGDGYWIKQKSGNVLGFFPAYMGTYESGYTHPNVEVYAETDTKSKKLYETQHDGDGYFSLEDAIVKDAECWAKVTFNFHTKIPCDGTEVEPRPSITGYIQLYQFDTKNYRNELVLGYYSKGC